MNFIKTSLMQLTIVNYVILFFLFVVFFTSCGAEQPSEEVSKTKVVYDSLSAYIKSQPALEEPILEDSTETKKETLPKDTTVVRKDTTTLISEKACDKFLDKLSEFSTKMIKSIKKKKEDPANEDVKKEYKKRKEEYFTWVSRVNDKSFESSWQKNNCNLDPNRKAKAQKILKKLEEEMKK